MIKVNNLTKKYFTEDIETLALMNVSFEIEKGEFIAIKGPSGCGKSTLLNIVGLIDSATTGSVLFNNEEIANISESKRTKLRKGKIGFIFQSFNLLENLTVFENVELPLQYLKYKSKDRKQLVSDILDKLEIGHRHKHFPNQLSGGQQQRVAVARAVVTDPDIILADEPTGNLDSQNGKIVMDILKKLNSEGKTIVMVTHSNDYDHYATRILNLFDGRLVNIR